MLVATKFSAGRLYQHLIKTHELRIMWYAYLDMNTNTVLVVGIRLQMPHNSVVALTEFVLCLKYFRHCHQPNITVLTIISAAK